MENRDKYKINTPFFSSQGENFPEFLSNTLFEIYDQIQGDIKNSIENVAIDVEIFAKQCVDNFLKRI